MANRSPWSCQRRRGKHSEAAFDAGCSHLIPPIPVSTGPRWVNAETLTLLSMLRLTRKVGPDPRTSETVKE